MNELGGRRQIALQQANENGMVQQVRLCGCVGAWPHLSIDRSIGASHGAIGRSNHRMWFPSTPTPKLSTTKSTQELESLDPATANVYKMMGPALLRVELEDARQNVAKRLELIKTQMYVVHVCMVCVYYVSGGMMGWAPLHVCLCIWVCGG